MYRLIAFVLTIAGGINWFMIGALQYDYVAGIFGLQSNVFSRIVYFIIGVASIYMLIIAVFTRGRIKLWGYKNKKPKKVEEDEF